ncbi:uncharacterized protein SCDLUD_004049 [Saccharomycodes ludwigii]|uniref:uncharacterized protein n=1 Tax=Saccharomycodes ludwigii TaxID=36035 RepID=UPI001E8AB110|nr:hypothetical protein SCDLUD_004049 [Saccharomycodes ludwigii]KAH3899761.1 hypothetical protein SCDLUD_004049 [Saccharomycodes ludwigii]
MPKEVPYFSIFSTNKQNDTVVPVKKKVSKACDFCRKRKIKCDGQSPCDKCQLRSKICTYASKNLVFKNATSLNNNVIITGQPTQPSLIAGNNSTNNTKSITKKTNSKKKVTKLLKNHQKLLTARISNQYIKDKDSNKNNTDPNYKEILQSIFPRINFNSENFSSKKLLNILQQYRISSPTETELLPINSISSQFEQRADTNSLHLDANKSINAVFNGKIKNSIKEPLTELPPIDLALKLIFKTWDSACILFRFYHRPSFIKILHSLYETNPTDYNEQQRKALPLIYSVIACGALFSKEDITDENTRVFYEDEGYRYFTLAKNSIDLTNSSDMYTIQAFFMMTLFLQCSANLSNSYSYIGIALRGALREGLHRRIGNNKISPLEAETRKRLFWTVYKMDIYMNCILGLPISVRDSDVCQELPLDVDDENIFADIIIQQQWGKVSSCGLNNEHTKLILILKKINDVVYPTKSSNKHLPSLDKISKLEIELNNWMEQLPLQLKPKYQLDLQQQLKQPSLSADVATHKENINKIKLYLKANNLLYLDYLHARIFIYRPFIHYIALHPSKYPQFTEQFTLAQKCIQLARKVVHVAQDMIADNLLSGCYWFAIHTIFFSVACLLYATHYNIESGEDIRRTDIVNDAKIGFGILNKIKSSSMASERIFQLLNNLFEKLNDDTVQLYREKLHELNSHNSDNFNAANNFLGSTTISSMDTNSVSRLLDIPQLVDDNTFIKKVKTNSSSIASDKARTESGQLKDIIKIEPKDSADTNNADQTSNYVNYIQHQRHSIPKLISLFNSRSDSHISSTIGTNHTGAITMHSDAVTSINSNMNNTTNNNEENTPITTVDGDDKMVENTDLSANNYLPGIFDDWDLLLGKIFPSYMIMDDYLNDSGTPSNKSL